MTKYIYNFVFCLKKATVFSQVSLSNFFLRLKSNFILVSEMSFEINVPDSKKKVQKPTMTPQAEGENWAELEDEIFTIFLKLKKHDVMKFNFDNQEENIKEMKNFLTVKRKQNISTSHAGYYIPEFIEKYRNILQQILPKEQVILTPVEYLKIKQNLSFGSFEETLNRFLDSVNFKNLNDPTLDKIYKENSKRMQENL